ncbi:family 10 glycosylhydrolase [bacterium]|nr:family 10 glycosylhydrolase [bacterium]
MCKLLKNIVISSLFFLLCTFQASVAAEKNYILQSFSKCSTQNDCSDILNSMKNINAPVEADIMKLENIIPKLPQNKNLNDGDSKSEITYNLPTDVYDLPEGKIYKQSSTYLSNIDPQKGEAGVNINYPGLRGANQLIVYTPDFGLRTGTNEFGAEAVVVHNTVVKLSGADSIIPREGFVISGHGKAKQWIQDNIILGTKIYINPKTLKIASFITPDTYIFEAQEKIKETSQVIEYYRMMDNCYDGRKAVNFLNKANDSIKKAQKHQDKAEYFLNQSKFYVNNALQYAIPYRPEEFKGIWIRPTEHNAHEISKTVDCLKNAGINNVFLETYYHGMTIYPSKVMEKYGITSQRGEFNTFDPLEIWIKECHKNNIKVHIWFETFYVGNKPPRSSRTHILAVHPEWANTTKALADNNELAYSVAEHNGFFIDPANPEVHQFLEELLNEIIENYKPDGINLDYIRYPQCAKIKSDSSMGTEWGYTKFARDEFTSIYGIDPKDLKVSDAIRQNWFEYRQKKVTDFVEKTRKLTIQNNITLTTVVFTDIERSLETKMQDWKLWSKRNLVDGFTPLLLTTDKKTAGSLIRDMKNQMNSNTKLYPGIFVMFMNAPTDELLLQVQETRKMHADGLILFDYAHFCENYQTTLKARAFNSNKKF